MCVQPRAGSRAGESLAVLGLRQHKSSKGHAEPAIDALIFAATGMPAVLAQVDSTTEALTDESKAVARAAMDRMCAAEAGVQCAADIHDVLEQRYTNGGPSEDDNFNPGTRHGATGGSPPPLLASSAQLFDYRPLSLTCIYVSVRAARLWCSMRTPLQPGCARARHKDLNAAVRAAGSTRFFGSCAHWHMRGFLRRCGCSRAEVSAPGGSLAVAWHAAGTHDARG
eukprot:COSAG06_NODE_1905_length_8095_cov_10.218984_3_plen_225_part_00